VSFSSEAHCRRANVSVHALHIYSKIGIIYTPLLKIILIIIFILHIKSHVVNPKSAIDSRHMCSNSFPAFAGTPLWAIS
jgi:hypothetical protein